jgi:hypothetical protein
MRILENLFRTLKIRRVLCFAVVAATGCIEEYVPTIITTDHRYLIVDGFLVANDSTFIKLSRSQLISDPAPFQGESEATIEIEGETGFTYILSEKTKGLYVAPALDLDPSLKYRLHIRTSDASEYVSDFVDLLRSPPLDSVVFEEAEDDEINFQIYAHDPEYLTRYYYWTYVDTWQYSGGYSVYKWENGQIVPRANAGELLFCWKTNSINNYYLHATSTLSEDVVYRYPLFTIKQTSRKLYYGYSIIVSQYALTREAYDYYNLTKKNSESLGSLFDPQPSQALGNIKCISNPQQIAIGYFAASTVQKKRLTFTRHDITGPVSSPYEPAGYSDCEPEILELDLISDQTLEGKLIIDRHYDLITQELVGYLVAPEYCIDCRFGGGVLQKPDYWK